MLRMLPSTFLGEMSCGRRESANQPLRERPTVMRAVLSVSGSVAVDTGHGATELREESLGMQHAQASVSAGQGRRVPAVLAATAC